MPIDYSFSVEITSKFDGHVETTIESERGDDGFKVNKEASLCFGAIRRHFDAGLTFMVIKQFIMDYYEFYDGNKELSPADAEKPDKLFKIVEED